MHKVFVNYKCRLCGNIISKEVNKLNSFILRDKLLLSKQFHSNCISDREKDEKCIADAISVSLRPLERAVDVIYFNESEDVVK